tara:strand:- start:92 stop:763 length:672 start_codon:yes stop_codon:yes gene_type:complete
MPHQKSKKIILYLFLFLVIGSLNNKNINDNDFSKISKIVISGLDQETNLNLLNSLEIFKNQNIFFLSKRNIKKIIDANNFVENYSIFKKYPNSLEIKITKAKLLAHVNKNGKNYLLGSNGKLIKTNDLTNNMPFIYGDFINKEFFKLKKIIDKSKFNYKNIKNLYYFPSGRWDIEFYSGVLIKLPKNRLKDSINLSVNILSNENFEKIKILDLRQKNRVITNG